MRPLEEVDAHLDAHKAYLDRYYASGTFLASGRRVPRTGGVILANCASREEAERLVAEDPFSVHGIARYEIIEFQPTKTAPALAPPA